MPIGDILGMWLAAGLTLFMFSFLYRDNPFYRIGENLFVGVTIGYSIVTLYYESWLPKVWHIIHPEAGVWFENRECWVLIFPVALGVLILTRFFPRYAWLSRWTFAFIVGYGSGLAIPATFTTSIQKQAVGTIQPLISRSPDAKGDEEAAKKAEEEAADLAAKKPGSDEWRASMARAEELRARADASKAAGAKLNAARKRADDAEKAAPPLEQAARDAEAKAFVAGKPENRPKGSAEELAALQAAEAARAARKAANEAKQAAITTRVAAWDAASRNEYTLLTFYRDLSAIILFLGVISTLVYFFFSIEHKGGVRVVSRIGVYFLMIYFGASYGYTVMGRLSLLYGRLTTLDQGRTRDYWYATPIILVIMIGVLAFLRFRNKGQQEDHA